MKTKEFIERAKELGCYVHHNETMNDFILQSECLSTVFGSVSNKLRYFDVRNSASDEVAELIIEYGMTPVDEREEEKMYRYKIKHNINNDRPTMLHVYKLNDVTIELDGSSERHASLSSNFHFTDKEVEKFTGKDRALFNACEKIEVTE